MTTHEPMDGKRPIPRLPIRNLYVVGGAGDLSMAATVYCPVQERSVAVAECDRCSRFHALHFDQAARRTSVVCHCETSAPGSAEVAALRDACGGPLDPCTPVADIMTKDGVCVRADVAIETISQILVERGFGGLPVVDEVGRPIGIVSKTDVLRAHHERGDAETAPVTARPRDRDDSEMGPGYHLCEPGNVTARDVMTPLALTVYEGTTIGQAASLMAYEGVHRLPVVADDGRVVGLLSSLDVLRWFGRQSGYLLPHDPRARP